MEPFVMQGLTDSWICVGSISAPGKGGCPCSTFQMIFVQEYALKNGRCFESF